MQRTVVTWGILAIFLSACNFPSPTEFALEDTIPCNVGELVNAINDANATPNTTDTINLALDCSYEFGSSASLDPDASSVVRLALRRITSPVVINGNRATLSRAPAAEAMRFFQVEEEGSLTLNNVTLTNGSVSKWYGELGGAIRNKGSLTITNSRFVSNGAGGGAAIVNDHPDALLSITDSDFIDNSAADYGGAIHNRLGTASVTASTFSGNRSSQGVGGAINNQDQFTIDGSVFSGNNATSGGAIASSGVMSIVGSSLTGNEASGAGGAIRTGTVGPGELVIEKSTIASNTAGGRGGGISNHASPAFSSDYSVLIIANSTISGNSSVSEGSAIHNESFLRISYSTIVENTGPSAALFTTTHYEIANSIIANYPQANCSYSETIQNSYNNLDTDGSCPGSIILAFPQIGPLAANGGLTHTHALLPNSPAINLSTEACPSTDQRGVSRDYGMLCALGDCPPVDQTELACDLGAYEYAPPEPEDVDATVTASPTATPTERLFAGIIMHDTPCYSGADASSSIVSSLKANTPVNLIGPSKAGDYASVDRSGVACWVEIDNVDMEDALLAAFLKLQAQDPDGLVTVTPRPTWTPSPTPDLRPKSALTPTPGAQSYDIIAIVEVDTLCWTGPGPVYDVVQSVLAGQQVKTLGEDGQKEYYILVSPRYAGAACWVRADDITVPKDILLPVIPIPPTPTPAPPTSTPVPPTPVPPSKTPCPPKLVCPP